MALGIVSAILGVVPTVGKIFDKWQERKLVKAEAKVRIEQAKADAAIKQVQTLIEADVDYDRIVAEGMSHSWKDEYWTIILSIPAVLCFVPGLDTFVGRGFQALSSCPDWYQWALLGSIVASFGLRNWKGFRK